MRTLTDHLAQYGAYHRDRRNVATHVVGIPLIVVGVNAMLARIGFDVAGHGLTVAALVDVAAAAFYLRLDRAFGLAMAVLLGIALAIGHWAAARSTPVWLAVGVGGFAVGWAFQFVGHAYEGRKPAFVDDLVGLAIGPLFVVAEIAFALGLRRDLARAVERSSGEPPASASTSASASASASTSASTSFVADARH